MPARSPGGRSQMEAVGAKPWPDVFAPAAALPVPPMSAATAQSQKPNMIVIVGDNIGWGNIGGYRQGPMYSTPPNLDQMASDRMPFTDHGDAQTFIDFPPTRRGASFNPEAVEAGMQRRVNAMQDQRA